MELKGQVILDEDTMDNLKKQIRREVIDEIKENGNYSFEIEKYMKNCDMLNMINLIEKDGIELLLLKSCLIFNTI